MPRPQVLDVEELGFEPRNVDTNDYVPSWRPATPRSSSARFRVQSEMFTFNSEN